jgi:hypothetical protein
MEEFIDFRTFLDHVREARLEDLTGLPNAASLSPQQLAGMKETIFWNYGQAEAVCSYLGDDNIYVDCIKAGTMPRSVPAAGADPEPPGFTRSPGEGAQTPPAEHGRPEEVRRDRFGHPMSCPPGTVPVQRLTLERLAHAGSGEDFFRKATRRGGT